MSNAAVLLTILGVAAIWAVLWVINGPQEKSPEFHCDSVSPDGKYPCMESMAHVGWCHNGDIEWRYESWAIGEDDDTRYAVEPEQVDPPTQVISRKRRLPRSAIALGVLAVMSVFNYTHDTAHPKPVTPSYDCDWNAVRCENWTSR